ncbi:hypothetical protein GCM10007859_17300 [Brevundimonas denitrificans]|uniref:UrcA family protein n=1 Tax=Brevundimonas denitrificans TaxID=1443434 RepID=A0ABQ6BKV0_9CAUL|nr:hypothetical protein [Brevundimonas denitrificans]GLS01715.1 hypothetical protein GCM10007859_17300 [Brevundimonas denitrificans]
MLLTMMAMTIQLAAPAGDPQIEIPDSALRDPYGFVLSHCSPLVRRSSESLEACEHRVGTALRARLPHFRPRPLATTVASASDDPPTATTGTAFGGRCTTRQDSQQSEDGSSSSGMIVCGDRSGAAASVLEGLLRPQ